ncbi:MAG: WecB/TagA/CpsF family glycosyltransferase [Candidatus Omnitrophica bacterium]|nr:WecB/TagA/CpsF family glycosyltransferase [Candidatus Omnitrophota bacterium]MDD5429422.1 WecB/TagA/CpsF family glycosyltransferase [Candidatus Omnitrophota bacterium]
MKKYIKVSGVRIDMVQAPEIIKAMEKWIQEKKYGNYIVVSNAYDFVMNSRYSNVKESANNSALTIPDGFSLMMLGRLYGYPLKKRAYGPDLMFEFIKLSQVRGYSHFFYGSTKETLHLLVNNMKQKFPNLKIAGVLSPPFRELSEEEKKEHIDIVNKAQPDVLWVGLGTPKQQLWMYEHKYKIKVPVMLGTGAAFDFLAGTKPQCPRWARDNGCEWLFRLVIEPKRLWKRYLIGNAVFLWIFAKEFIKVKFLRKTTA